MVIATNSFFSNPTRDWVKEWQENNSRPIIKLWERSNLENLCSRHPLAIIRLYSKALSPQGRVEVVRTRLWDYLSFSEGPYLKQIWESRDSLEISPEALIALIASEFANGDITLRPWAAYVNKEILFNSLTIGLANCIQLAFKADSIGAGQKPLIKALSYMVLVFIERFGVELTTKILENYLEFVENITYSDEIKKILRDFAIRAILGNLVTEISDICTSDCMRVLKDPNELTEKEIKLYWGRLIPEGRNDKKEDLILKFEVFKKPCEVGFKVGKKKHCPLCLCEHPENDIGGTIKMIKAVKDFRQTQLKQPK